MATAPFGCLSNPTPHPAADAGFHTGLPDQDDDARGTPEPSVDAADGPPDEAGADAGLSDACSPVAGDVAGDALADGVADGSGGCEDTAEGDDVGPTDDGAEAGE
jgi:hypothetical protein